MSSGDATSNHSLSSRVLNFLLGRFKRSPAVPPAGPMELPRPYQSVLIFGGANALGKRCVQQLKNTKETSKVWVVNVDYVANSSADVNIMILSESTAEERLKDVLQSLGSIMEDRKRVDAVLFLYMCNRMEPSDDLVSQFQYVTTEVAWNAVNCTSVAQKYLAEDGLLVISGSAGLPAQQEQLPNTMTLFHLVKSLAAPESGFPPQCVVVGIQPKTDQQFADCIVYVSDILVDDWIVKRHLPPSGSICEISPGADRT